MVVIVANEVCNLIKDGRNGVGKYLRRMEQCRKRNDIQWMSGKTKELGGL